MMVGNVLLGLVLVFPFWLCVVWLEMVKSIVPLSLRVCVVCGIVMLCVCGVFLGGGGRIQNGGGSDFVNFSVGEVRRL